MQFFFVLFSVLDIRTSDMPTCDLTIAAANRIIPHQEPSITSVLSAYPLLILECRTLGQGTVPLRLKLALIVGMDVRARLQIAPLAKRNAKIVQCRAVCVETLAARANNANDLGRQIEDLTQLLFACAYRPHQNFLISDIDRRSQELSVG